MGEIEELIKEIDAFSKERDWDKYHTPANIAKSISIEAGELLECFHWNDSEYNLDDIRDELADVFSCCLQMALALNIDIRQAVLNKMKKNAEKYPVEKAKGKALKYYDL